MPLPLSAAVVVEPGTVLHERHPNRHGRAAHRRARALNVENAGVCTIIRRSFAGTDSMRRRSKIILLSVLAFVVIGLVALRLSANGILRSVLASTMHDLYRLDVTTTDVSLSLLSGGVKLHGLHITDGGDPVFDADEIEISASISDLVRGRYEFRTLVITRPVLHMVVEKGGSTNLARIFSRPKPSPDAKPSSGPAPFVGFRDARIIDGRFVLEDSVTNEDHKGRLSFEDLDIALTELQVAGERDSSELGDLRLDALLTQSIGPARISIVGWAPSLTAPLSMAVHVAITGLDLSQMPQYVDKSARKALGGDVIHIAATLQTKDDVIETGAVAATIAESDTRLSLRFGGTLSHIVFDKDSQLSALFALPLGRLGHVGDVALTSTWNAAGGVGKGVIGAGGAVAGGVGVAVNDMAKLDPLGALGAAGGGLLEGTKQLGEGIVGVFGSLFGGGEADEKKDKDQQRRFSEMHTKCRRAMLVAAKESAKESSAARQRRIEEELAKVPL
jgi:hypothetical protein